MTKLLKKYLLPAILVCCLLATTFMFSGCNKPTKIKEYELIAGANVAYTQGTQTIQITPLEYPPLGGEPATFKESITKSDIELLGILSTKIVDNVIFENEQSIKVVISGNAKPFNGNTDQGKIRIKKNGLNNDSNAYGYIDVEKPSAFVESFAKSGTLQKGYTFQAIIQLTCGTFTDISQVEFLGNIAGTVKEKYLASANRLVIEINDITNYSGVPQIIIREGATTLGKVINLGLSENAQSFIEN